MNTQVYLFHKVVKEPGSTTEQFRAVQARNLAQAYEASDCDNTWEVVSCGQVVNFRRITCDAAAMGRKGGRATTEAKVVTARANGRKGGRPQSNKTQS